MAFSGTGTLVATGVGVVSVAAVALIADTAVAARAEAKVASAVADASDLDIEPQVSIGGTPYLASLLSGEIGTMSVAALDVDTPGFGLVNASTELDGLTVSPEQVLSGDLEGAAAKLSTQVVSLDAVAVGEQLNIQDLDISNPYDISPSGGAATEVQLTGTPEGFSEPVSVLASLRLDNQVMSMAPYVINGAPEGREDDVREAFSWQCDTRQLPLDSRVEAISVGGGSLRFEAQRRNIVVKLNDLAPLESSTASDFDSTVYGETASLATPPAG